MMEKMRISIHRSLHNKTNSVSKDNKKRHISQSIDNWYCNRFVKFLLNCVKNIFDRGVY